MDPIPWLFVIFGIRISRAENPGGPTFVPRPGGSSCFGCVAGTWAADGDMKVATLSPSSPVALKHTEAVYFGGWHHILAGNTGSPCVGLHPAWRF